MSERAESGRGLAVAVGLLLAAIGVALGAASRNWHSPGMLGHEFRQSQTALTAQVIERDGFKLAYETPVLGKPWSIPMEFPLYQWLVARLAAATGWGIIEAGRTTALACFLAGLPAWWLLVRMAGYGRGAACLGLVPIVVAPVYVFYSRTVMIESLAWTLGAWFLWAVLRYRAHGGAARAALAAGVGALAVLGKSTTWAVFCVPWALLYLHDAGRWIRRREGSGRRLLVQALGIGLPLLALGFAWVAYTDHIKARNPIAQFLLSSELREFNFGTWAARQDPAQWAQVGRHFSNGVIPLWGLALALVLILTTRRTRLVGALALAGLAAGPLIFFNLYYFHDYYFYASGAFGAGLVGLAAAEGWDRSGGRRWIRWLAPLLVVAVAVGQLRAYHEHLEPTQLQDTAGDYGLTRILRSVTKPDDVIVVQSPSWGSSLPFYAERRMLTIPDFRMFYDPAGVRRAIGLLEDENVPLLVVWGQSRVQGQWTAERIDELGLWPRPIFDWGNDATIYARADLAGAIRDEVRRLDVEGARLDTSQQLTPPEQHHPIAGTPDGERIRGQTGMTPEYGYMPFGMPIIGYQGRPTVLVHAISELYFKVPPGARRLKLAYVMNPDSYTQRDFDGVCVMVEGVENNQVAVSLHRGWLSPLGERGMREVTVDLPPGMPDTVVFRVLPGPGDNKAYDQLWLADFRFE